MISKTEHQGPLIEPFPGFDPLTANYLYCPNQFFDLCLPNHSRGVVRLVAYLLRRTLGWLDKDGSPLEQDIAVSYQDLITNAGISRGAVGQAITEAVAARFIACVQQGRPDRKDQPGHIAQYTLLWDTTDEYRREPDTFRGFFAGDGYRTPIPNAFFDRIVPMEPLTVGKVVGAVLRHTVGYQNQFGGRRSHAPLSYSYIQKYANIASRRALAEAVHHAIATGYISCVTPGSFSAGNGVRSAATYAIRWLPQHQSADTSSKRIPGERFKKDTSEKRDRFKKETSTSSKRIPGERFKKDTKEITELNNTPKQQQGIAAADFSESRRLLTDVGFDGAAAVQLARAATLEVIQQQVAWLNHRKPRDNRLGMLRTAIEQQWPEPPSARSRNEQRRSRERDQQKRTQDEQKRMAEITENAKRQSGQKELLKHWQSLPEEKRLHFFNRAINQTTSAFVRARLRRNRDINSPPVEALTLMAAELSLAK